MTVYALRQGKRAWTCESSGEARMIAAVLFGRARGAEPATGQDWDRANALVAEARQAGAATEALIDLTIRVRPSKVPGDLAERSTSNEGSQDAETA